MIFRIMGVPWTADCNSWKFIPPKIVIGVIAALIALPLLPLVERLIWGLIYGILFLTVMGAHIVGHIIASKRVSPPMTEAYITPVLIETRYASDPPDLPDRVHLIRSLGGPVANIVAGFVFGAVLLIIPHHLIAFLMWANWAFAVVVLLPFKGIDGGVIWPILTRRRLE